MARLTYRVIDSDVYGAEEAMAHGGLPANGPGDAVPLLLEQRTQATRSRCYGASPPRGEGWKQSTRPRGREAPRSARIEQHRGGAWRPQYAHPLRSERNPHVRTACCRPTTHAE